VARRDIERAAQPRRPVEAPALPAGDRAWAIVQFADRARFNLAILGVAAESDAAEPSPVDADSHHAKQRRCPNVVAGCNP
jgi:hypothetical protein